MYDLQDLIVYCAVGFSLGLSISNLIWSYFYNKNNDNDKFIF